MWGKKGGGPRAGAEALRADEISWLKSLRDGFVKAVDRRIPAPDYKDVNGDTAIGEAAEKVKDVMRAITVRIKELARLSPPAPAPKVDEERLMENLKDFKTFDNRMHGKPAPETAKCPNLPGHETHSPPCGFDYSILDPKHSATAKAVVGKESKMGLEATAPLEAPTQPPAAENAPCPDHSPELQWVCETCGERTAPV